MKTALRALRALIRNPLRATLLIGVLSVSIGLTLIMITVNGAFATRMDDIESGVGTDVTVRPAGSFGGGFFAGGFARNGNDPNDANAQNNNNQTQAAQPAVLTDQDIDKIASVAHVTGVARTLTVPYTGTELTSSLPTPQGRQARGGPRPLLVTGTDDPSTLATVGVQNVQLTSGRTFTSDEMSANVALMGQALAQANGLSTGSTFKLNNTDFQLIGVFTTGTQFGDNSIFIPLTTALFGRTGEVDQAIVRADTGSNVDQVATDIRQQVGTDKVDVTTDQSVIDRITAPLSDARDSSRIGTIVALIASGAIILFSIGIVARQRIKEIGILKAVGASNWHVIGQFGVETAGISIVAALIGALATFPLAQKVADGLLSSPSTGGNGGRGQALLAGATRTGGLLGSVNIAVSPEVFLYALAIAIGLAIVATVVPAWYVGRVRPAEVLRHE